MEIKFKNYKSKSSVIGDENSSLANIRMQQTSTPVNDEIKELNIKYNRTLDTIMDMKYQIDDDYEKNLLLINQNAEEIETQAKEMKQLREQLNQNKDHFSSINIQLADTKEKHKFLGQKYISSHLGIEEKFSVMSHNFTQLSHQLQALAETNHKQDNYMEKENKKVLNHANKLDYLNSKSVQNQDELDQLKVSFNSFKKIYQSYSNQVVEKINKLIMRNNLQIFKSSNRQMNSAELSHKVCKISHTNIVYSLAILKDESIACGSWKIITISNSTDGSVIKTLNNSNTNFVHFVLVVLDDGHLVSASSGNSDKDIVIWNVSTGVPINTLKGHLKAVMCLTVLGGNRIASGSMDHSIIIWDAGKGTHLKTLKGHQLEVRSIVELEDDRLASGSEDNTICQGLES